MRFRFITGDYDNIGLYWLCRGEDGKKEKLHLLNFHPYFYLDEVCHPPTDPSPIKIEEGFRKVFTGDRMRKLYFRHPGEVAKAREKYLPQACGEDDIRFVIRSLIDTDVKSGFEVSPIISNVTYINPSKITPCSASHIPLKLGYIDIEVLSKGRFPDATRPNDKIICVTFCQDKTFHTLLLGEKSKSEKRGDWEIITVPKEEELIEGLKTLLKTYDTDILVSWGNFDWNYLVSRCGFLGLKWDVECIPLNLITFYRTLERGSARLKSVVKKEGLVDEVKFEEFHSEWYGRDNEKLLEYNRKDVEFLMKVDKEFHLSEFAIALKEFAGLPDFELYPSQIVDSVILRKYHNSGWVFPSRRGRKDESGLYSGAHIETAKAGFYENVGVFDMSSYYLSIIISKKLTFENDGNRLPELVREILSLKDNISQLLKKAEPGSREYLLLESQKQAVKSFLLSLYGVLGDASSRFFKVEFASTVTETGRKGIQFVKEVSPYPVLYIHTDSLFLQAPFEECQRLETFLNDKLKEFSAREGLDPSLTLKFERFYDTIIFTGVKARHAGHVCWEGKPVDYIRIAGYEAIRGDSSELTREVQEKVLDFILRKKWNEIIPYLKQVVREFPSYPIEKIAIPKTLRQEEYTKSKPNYVRGAEYAMKYLGEEIRAGDTVYFIPVVQVPKGLPPTDVVSVTDPSKLKGFVPNYDELIEKTVKAKVEDFLPVVGLNWGQVRGQSTLGGWS